MQGVSGLTGIECYSLMEHFSISVNSGTFLLKQVHVSVCVFACPEIFPE